MKVYLSPRRLVTAIVVIALGNGFFLAGTALALLYYPSLPVGSALGYLVIQLNLDTENVLAAWYSSMLMLLASLTALLCFFAYRGALHCSQWLCSRN